MRRRYRKLRRRKHKSLMRNTIIVMVVLTLGFATGYSAFSTNITLNAKGNIKQKSRVIRSWTGDSVDDFHNSQYRTNIVSATFLDTTNIPSGVEESWDVSADGKGGVIAYVMINEEDHTKYDLYIGAKNGVIANEDSSYIFYNFANLENIDFDTNYNTEHTTNMSWMFANSIKIKVLDLSTFNTNNVNSMRAMFAGFTTSNVQTNMALESIDLSSFNTVNVSSMHAMFMNCSNLTELDLSNFDTRNVTNMRSMFNMPNDLSSKLTTINFGSGWNTSNVTTMAYMFDSCKMLTELDLSYFNTIKVEDMYEMFYYCDALKTIYVSNNFNVSNVTNSGNMFFNNNKLVGGNGTVWNSSHVDKEYARIDTASTPGYFTLKTN